MKIVINTTFGGFCVPKAYCAKRNCDYLDEEMRTDPDFIQWVEENHPKEFGTSLGVVHIPDVATDWEIAEYDGLEHIICVIDGKIYHLDQDSMWGTTDDPDDWVD